MTKICFISDTHGAHLGLRTSVVFGGVGIQPQIAGLRAGLDVLVATPGRLVDLMEQREVTISSTLANCAFAAGAGVTLALNYYPRIDADRLERRAKQPQRHEIISTAPSARLRTQTWTSQQRTSLHWLPSWLMTSTHQREAWQRRV